MSNVKLKVFKNKSNNQLLVTLKRKDLIKKGKTPKYLKINKKDLVY